MSPPSSRTSPSSTTTSVDGWRTGARGDGNKTSGVDESRTTLGQIVVSLFRKTGGSGLSLDMDAEESNVGIMEVVRRRIQRDGDYARLQRRLDDLAAERYAEWVVGFTDGTLPIETLLLVAVELIEDELTDRERKFEELYETCDTIKSECNRLHAERVVARRVTPVKAFGKNKQGRMYVSQNDASNQMALNKTTSERLWPTTKFLSFDGVWKLFDIVNPHPFAKFVMSQVTVPDCFAGTMGEYYCKKALPMVWAKLSTLRSNFVVNCGKQFKR